MKSGKNKPKWDYIEKRVLQSAKDMLYKKHLPKKYEMYLKDSSLLDTAIEETFRGPFREWACGDCGIVVYGPRQWLHMHLPIHGKFDKRENRENEIYEKKFNLY